MVQETVMNREFHWVFGPLAFAIAFAFIAPVFAGEAVKNVALTNDARSGIALRSTIVSGDAAAESSALSDYIATGAPVRLSPLAGNDSIAWDNANSIHAWQRPAKIRFALH